MTPNFPNKPQAKTLEEAQEIITALWDCVVMQAKQIEAQVHQIEALNKQVAVQADKIRELEEKLNTNSRNSSKSPSTDFGSNTPAKKARSKVGENKKKQGAQPGHRGRARTWLPEEQVDHIEACHPATMCPCGGVVAMSESYRAHQSIELPEIKAIVTEYRVYAGICAGCGQRHEGALPAGVTQRLLQSRALGIVGTLAGGYRLSKRLVQCLLHDLFKLDISLGTISQSEEEVSDALKKITEQAHEHIKNAQHVHADETGHKEKNVRHWLWVAVAGMVSVFLVRASRSTAVAMELLGNCFLGTLNSDRYAAYGWIEAKRRQLCWAHLLRDFTKIAERGGASRRIGETILNLAQDMFGHWKRVRDGTLSRKEFQALMQPIQASIEAAIIEGATFTEKRDAKTVATCKRLLTLKDALWRFVSVSGIEPTNNLAERTIRHYVMWRKISLGSQSKRGSLYIERVMTVVGSCKLQGRNVFDFITDAIRAHRGDGSYPSLIPAST